MKRILLIATGGTIASTEDGNGLSPALTGEELAQSVPEISGLCELNVVQPMNIDSTNMRPSDWMRIRDVIVEGYADHDGFVILHGTDTMSYTAAALSYLIQDSPKPIVLTGSQKPMGNPFTDAKLNLYQSLLYALDEHSHDVSIVFGGVAIAGTRARKQRTMSFNAFISVNYPPIAYIRNDRIVRNGLHGTHQGENPVRFYDNIDPHVFVLKLTPGVNPGILDALADSYDAVILETFGIGGIPEFGESGESFQEAIFRWVDSGRTVVMTTQVPEEGLDLGVYEVGRAYADHPGILRGDDMTTETLVAKTSHAHRTTPRRLDDAAQELINRNLTRATERRQRAARHVKARQLLHELHGGHEHGNRTRSLARDKLVKQRHHLVEPALAQKKAHRLISGAHGTLDDLGALRNKDALLRLQHAAKLTLGQSHVGIEPLVLERINSQNLNGISHSSQPAPFFTAHLYQTRRR